MDHKQGKICNIVDIHDVPAYNCYGTMKNEWCLKKHHFSNRRNDKINHWKRTKLPSILGRRMCGSRRPITFRKNR